MKRLSVWGSVECFLCFMFNFLFVILLSHHSMYLYSEVGCIEEPIICYYYRCLCITLLFICFLITSYYLLVKF